jgi:hypothetical protein
MYLVRNKLYIGIYMRICLDKIQPMETSSSYYFCSVLIYFFSSILAFEVRKLWNIRSFVNYKLC